MIIKCCIENIEIQVGGGIRTIEKATQLLSNNIRRIIVGTAAITNDTFRKQNGKKTLFIANML